MIKRRSVLRVLFLIVLALTVWLCSMSVRGVDEDEEPLLPAMEDISAEGTAGEGTAGDTDGEAGEDAKGENPEDA